MKKRVSRIVNFFAINLLFFALYLNFVHKDTNTITTTAATHPTVSPSQTVLVDNPEQYLKKEHQKATTTTNQLAKATVN